MAETDVIRTPDQRVRVFVSSALQELAAERRAVRDAVTSLRLVPVMFELGARPDPPRPVYRAYLAQSQVFVGIYWQSYGWVAPGEQISGLEDEYQLSAGLPQLIYVKSPAPDRDPRLAQMLARIRDEGDVSYQHFSDPAELQQRVENDLAVLLSERFEMTRPGESAADAAPLAGTVPAPATPLLGREQETAVVEELVTGEAVRLVTLTGPGGVGKSPLMVEAARRLGPGFADGARFVALASVSAADLVAAAIAAGLGLNTSAGRLITDLESYLRPRRLLLALDNFEQVIGAAPLLAELLGAAPGLVVLVTSRTVLRLSGEHEFPVSPLPVPPARPGRDLADLQRYASVSLFTERAHAVAPGFELTDANAGAVAEICRRLDGLPLAIELAAARVRLLPPQELASRLDQRFSVLTGGARDLPERQRTLRNTLDWSYGLLPAGEQALFARLGVFAGPFSLPAAEAVCALGEGQPSGPWRPSLASKTTRGVPCACSPPRARNWKPAAAAGCTPTCRAPRTTMPSWPRCAPASATRDTRRPKPGADPSEAGTPDSTHWSDDPAVGTRPAGPARTAQPDPACPGHGPTDSKWIRLRSGVETDREASQLAPHQATADAEAPQIRLICTCPRRRALLEIRKRALLPPRAGGGLQLLMYQLGARLLCTGEQQGPLEVQHLAKDRQYGGVTSGCEKRLGSSITRSGRPATGVLRGCVR